MLGQNVQIYFHLCFWVSAARTDPEPCNKRYYYYSITITCKIRCSSVSILTRLRAGRPGFTSRQWQCWDFFSSPSRPDRLWGPPSFLSTGYKGAFSLGVKRPVREADHSPPSSTDVKVWVELYLHSPIRLHGVVLI